MFSPNTTYFNTLANGQTDVNPKTPKGGYFCNYKSPTDLLSGARYCAEKPSPSRFESPSSQPRQPDPNHLAFPTKANMMKTMHPSAMYDKPSLPPSQSQRPSPVLVDHEMSDQEPPTTSNQRFKSGVRPRTEHKDDLKPPVKRRRIDIATGAFHHHRPATHQEQQILQGKLQATLDDIEFTTADMHGAAKSKEESARAQQTLKHQLQQSIYKRQDIVRATDAKKLQAQKERDDAIQAAHDKYKITCQGLEKNQERELNAIDRSQKIARALLGKTEDELYIAERAEREYWEYLGRLEAEKENLTQHIRGN